ncbi:MAG: PqqD family protein [Candidatus Bathyarchaeia archaeon]|nr:PqqD family protein [Candidatus Bathyarchaeota archaeon]
MVFSRLFKRKKKRESLSIPRSLFLKAKPVRNPALKWEKDRKTKEIKIIVPLKPPSQRQEQKQQKKGFLDKLFPPEPGERIINLDKVGSIVWELCDGEKTIGDIVNHLVEKYRIMPEEAELSLNAYFNQLSKRGLVGFVVPEEAKGLLKEFSDS